MAMWALFRGTIVLGGALALGSWIGLGRPPIHDVRDAENLLARVAAPRSLAPGGAPSAPAAPTTTPAEEERAIEFGPTPEQRDPSLVPTLAPPAPWPRLNPEASIAKAWLVAEGPERQSGRRLVTLTFDDGPFLETTPSVLRVLAKYNLHATFFVIGEYLDGDDRRAAATRRLLQKIVDGGHLVGNHTWDHYRLSQASHAKIVQEIDDCATSVERAIGKKPILFRPPYGELDDFGREAARERGLEVMLWSVAVDDMKRTDSHRMFHELTTQLEHKEGGMVLLHDIRFPSIAALRELLAWLHERHWDPAHPEKPGYDVVDMPTYLKAVAAAPLPYETRDDLNHAREAAREHASRR